jgi:hypothetical protein
MTCWDLFDYSCPSASEGELAVVVCAIERTRGGYRLILRRDGHLEFAETHAAIATARRKAAALRAAFTNEGWRHDRRLLP